MDALQQAAHCNNEGVGLLLAHKPKAAIQLFHQALRAVQRGSEVSSVLYRNTSLRHAVGTSALRCRPYHGDCGGSEPIRRPKTAKRLDVECSYFVYNRPFVIALMPSPIQSRDEFAEALDLAGSHILFNLALAWHERVQSTGRQAAVVRAAKQYGILLNLVTRMLRKQLGDNASYERLKFLVFNNLAHLHYEQCQYSKVTKCLDIMVDMLMAGSIDSGLDDSTSSRSDSSNDSTSIGGRLEKSIHPDDLSDIYWNALHARPPSMAPAA